MAVQRAILALLLAGDPVARTLPELGREIGDRESVERAVDTLVGYGLVEVIGGASQSLLPTRTARHAHRLEAW
jgi:hypothetical protein